MKKVLFLSCLILVLSGCASKKTEVSEKVSDTSNIQLGISKPVNYSSLDESFEGQVISVDGVVGGSLESGFNLTNNPDSKSAVTFVLKEDPENKKAYEQLSEKKGTVITVKGVLLDASKKWSKVISVQSISE